MTGHDQPTNNVGEKSPHKPKTVSKQETNQERGADALNTVTAREREEREKERREREKERREREKERREREKEQEKEAERERRELARAEQEYFKAIRMEAEQKLQRRRRVLRSITSWLITLGFAVAVWYVLNQTDPAILRTDGWYVALAGFLGASLGGSELVSRYRDEPLQALVSWPGFTYILLNAVISISAYGLLTRYSETIIPQLTQDPLMRSIVAGFGAMAILRSKFFTLRTEKGEDIGVGPDAAISAFLSAADRGVDRKRAEKRLRLVFSRVESVTDYSNVKDFIKVSLSAFQNLNEPEKERINNKIEEIYVVKSDSYPGDELKLQALCYEVLVIAGEYNFNSLINNLTEFITHLQEKHPEVDRKDREESLKNLVAKVAEGPRS